MSAAEPLDVMSLPLSGTRLIEASAGTGKTFTIAALYVRLMLGHGNDQDLPPGELLPPDILVVTFTEAATQELRERIRARLSQAARHFREPTATADPFLDALRAAYPPNQWPACAQRLATAANWMDEAAVYTIHGWCNRMLQQHAFDSGSLFRQQVDNDDQTLWHETVRDYWRTFFYPLPAGSCRAVLQIAGSPEQLIAQLQPLLTETEAQGLDCDTPDIAALLQAWADWEKQCRQLDRQARQAWAADEPALRAQLSHASISGWLNGNSYRANTFAARLADLSNWALGGASIDTATLARFGQDKLHAGLVKAHRDKTEQLRHPALAHITELTDHLRQEPDVGHALLRHALAWVRQRYANQKQRAATMTFDDMLTRLDQALRGDNGPRLAEAIRRQYPLALIDEFQDTDPVQYRIFARLYPAESTSGHGCLLIGDPKQAIYSFRGADIYTYLKAHHATQGRHYTLGTNFRSTTAMVAAVNQVFLQAEQQPEGAFKFRGDGDDPLPFLPVAAAGRDDEWLSDGNPAPALTLWHWQTEQAVGLPDYRAILAESAASAIVGLLNAAGQGTTGFRNRATGTLQALQPGDIAILVRSGNEAKAMRRALARRQLRSVYLSERDSVFASAAAADLSIWLRALAEPHDERKVRAALSTATLGWSHQALQCLIHDEVAWERHLERFLGYRQRWQQDGILPALRDLLSDYDLPTRLLQAVDGERCLTNLLHLAEWLQQAAANLDGEQALIRAFAEALADDRAREEHVIRLESDADLVKIVTIHKSKGLEYPLVFLPFVCSFRDTGRSRYYRYHDAEHNLCIALDKNETLRARCDAERLQEDLRLLYVALTRARHACWLGVAPIKAGSGKDCQLEKSAFGSLLDWQPGTPAAALADKLAQLKADCAAIVIEPLPTANDTPHSSTQVAVSSATVRQSTATIADDWWIASYSALPTGDRASVRSAEPETADDDKRRDEADTAERSTGAAAGLHALPRGAGPGVAVHAVLENCARIGFGAVRADPNLTRQLLERSLPTHPWQAVLPAVDQALRNWLTLPLVDNLSLAELPPGSYQAELEFLLGCETVDGNALDALVSRHLFNGQPRPALLPTQLHGLLKGFIDLVFVANGRYYLVDYKFNALGDSDAAYTPETLRTAMLTKRYDLQCALYLLALHRLLKTRLGDTYDCDRHLGGALYWFLRGVNAPGAGRLALAAPRPLLEGLDALFAGNPGATQP